MMKAPSSIKAHAAEGQVCMACGGKPHFSEGGRIGKSGSEVLSEVAPSQPKPSPEHSKHAAMNAKRLPTDEEVHEGFKKQSALRAQEREEFKAKKRKERGYAEGGEVSQPKPESLDRTARVASGTVKAASGADIKDPKSWWAKGGDVEGEEPEASDHMNLDDDEMDGEISEALGHELMSAIESKEPKKIMETLEACVLSCMMKGNK